MKRLILQRKTHPALGVNDTKFLHMDFTPGRRVMVWQRGSDDNPVIVAANFSDFESQGSASSAAEYVVPNWPHRSDFQWREITQARDVPAEWVGREPFFAWEAKVYCRR